MQRLTLARVLYQDAPLIVPDGPTAALDPEAEVYAKFNDIWAAQAQYYQRREE